MGKIDLDKFIISMFEDGKLNDGWLSCGNIIKSLKDQNLEIKDNEIVEIQHKPKYKVGDWITGANNVFKITSLNDELNCYIAVTQNGEKVKIPYQFDDGQGHMCSYHLWTIADARPGDILTDGILTVIFKEAADTKYKNYIIAYAGLDTSKNIQVTNDVWTLNDDVRPATKEQIDKLFNKLEEAGYKWNETRLELKTMANFKVGDWIIYDGTDASYKVTEVNLDEYCLIDINGYKSFRKVSNVNRNARLWTIKDAKQGDILADDDSIIIFKKIGTELWSDVINYYAALFIDTNQFHIQKDNSHWGLVNNTRLYPATKEQCELLLQKIKDNSYEWDDSKKELKKIEKYLIDVDTMVKNYKNSNDLGYESPTYREIAAYREGILDTLEKLKIKINTNNCC